MYHFNSFHGVIYSGNEKIVCSICDDMVFLDIANLKYHMKQEHVHDGKKPNKCSICNVNFSSKMACLRHIARIHDPLARKQFKCHLCNTSFPEKASLKRHYESKKHKSFSEYKSEISKKVYHESEK